MTATGEPLEIQVGERVGRVSGLLLRPPEPWAGYVLAHGAGAGMRHRSWRPSPARSRRGGSPRLRYQFPYTEAGGRRPDPPGAARGHGPGRGGASPGARCPRSRSFAGGKSMGGRMTSDAAARAAARRAWRDSSSWASRSIRRSSPAMSRAEHLARVGQPMLFLQGTRDDLADLTLVSGVCAGLGDRATLHVVEGADHGFGVLKRSGRTGCGGAGRAGGHDRRAGCRQAI